MQNFKSRQTWKKNKNLETRSPLKLAPLSHKTRTKKIIRETQKKKEIPTKYLSSFKASSKITKGSIKETNAKRDPMSNTLSTGFFY